jgi:hypothetical protein
MTWALPRQDRRARSDAASNALSREIDLVDDDTEG